MPDELNRCEVCQSLLDEEDLFCANCGREVPPKFSDNLENSDGEQSSGKAPEGRIATHNFDCEGCGASMSFDAREGKLRCPFCGSTKMNRRRDAETVSPRRVVEFAVSQDEAERRLREWLGRGFFRPNDLGQKAAVVEMTPVYVPYWVFKAKVHTHWTADSSQTPPSARGNWYPLAGEHSCDYDGLLVGASGALHPAETAAICPFDLASAHEPDAVDLDNVTVEQFGIGRKYARPIAHEGLEQLETAACAALVPGSTRNVHVNLQVEAMESEPVLLPVWIMAYRYKDKVYRFLVNGQTGKSTGNAPYSALKIAAVAVAIAAFLAIAAAILLSVH